MPVSGNPIMARAANRKIQVQSTKGNVSELMPHRPITLLNPARTHTVSAAQSTSASHIHTLPPRKVGKAHPTSMPLKPQSPSSPSLCGRRNTLPAAVAATRPSSAPHATAPCPPA